MMLHTTALEPTSYDAIVFNFGMHDIDYSKLFPEVSEGSFVFSLLAVFKLYIRSNFDASQN